jgi:hypothetical protein
MKTNTPFGADFEIVFVESEFILIKDLDLGNKSVTNDAEAVVEMLLDSFGDRRIFYYDSTNEIDELEHDGKRFATFGAGIPDEFISQVVIEN